MLRAASLPGQTFSRLGLRVQLAPCRLSQTRRVFLSQFRGADESPEHSDPAQLLYPSHVHLSRPQNDGGLSFPRQKPPHTSTQLPNGSGTTEDAHDTTHSSSASDQVSPRSSSIDGLPPLPAVKLSTLVSDLRCMRSERDVMKSWDIYQELQKPLSNVNRFGGGTTLLYTSLHHLVKLLSATTPRTEVTGTRIISVLSTLRQVGARIRRWQLELLRAIVKEQNLHPQNLEHLKDLVVDILPPSSNPNTTPPTPASNCEDTTSPLSHVPPDDLSEIDFSNEFQSPILVSPIPTTFTQDHERARLLNVIGETQSFSEAWDAYRAFSSHPLAEDPTLNTYPSRHLHRLVSLLATIKPRTRKVYLSLVSIISTLRASGHLIYTWEWNFLVDASAKGWRKTRFEDYKTSLRVFNDMLAYQREVRESNSQPYTDHNVRADSHDEGQIPHNNLAPDIYSYTTLISHAARTLSPQALDHARSILNSAGIVPNRVTLLAQLRLHTYHNQMYGVRRTIAEIRDRGFTLDIYGVNSIIWAFARNAHMEVAEAIYRVLRNNIDGYEPEDSAFDGADEGIDSTVRFLDETENILIPPSMVPDRITYTILIQSYSYHGDLARSLQFFADMLYSPDPLMTWRGNVGAGARFQPVMQIFRALFLGFYHHAVGPSGPDAHPCGDSNPQGSREQGLEWNLDNLNVIFKEFLELPADRRPENRVVYWLVMAFEKCSGGDYCRMKEVWAALESKWGDQWGSRLRRARSRIYQDTEHVEVTSDDDKSGDASDGDN
ncbi:hypothetical protein BJ322DRAFT_1126260 [Thelephora terrestris]|uniref:Pentatricopeptide repeat protein n=1 Tax=Thelephora terrestris TaxID=56493 RepID=A0A9P6HCW0_9AGAM|nr:hypothetical protein BJ322DRAFT_1126260 [Thelephora terrestris]